MLLFVERGIRETLTVECAGRAVPFPLVAHWFAWFYGFHGGRLLHENEANESRGDFDITNWQPGGE